MGSNFDEAFTEVFDEAFDYLLTSTRTYVTAIHLRDKFLAIQLILISEVMSIDSLLSKFRFDIGSKNSLEQKNLKMLPLQTYYERISDLEELEKNKPAIFSNINPPLSVNLKKTIDYVNNLYDSDYKQLLTINFKELLNEAQFFIFKVKRILFDNREDKD